MINLRDYFKQLLIKSGKSADEVDRYLNDARMRLIVNLSSSI